MHGSCVVIGCAYIMHILCVRWSFDACLCYRYLVVKVTLVRTHFLHMQFMCQHIMQSCIRQRCKDSYITEITPLVLPSKALMPFIAVHIQLVAQYTYLELRYISYSTIYHNLDTIVYYLIVFKKHLCSFQSSFTKPCHISAA